MLRMLQAPARREPIRTAVVCTTAAAVAGLATGARADFEWIGGSSLDWSDVANWLENGAPAMTVPGCGDAAGANVLVLGSGDPILVQCPGGAALELGNLEATTPLVFTAPITLSGEADVVDFVTQPGFQLLFDQGSLDITGTDAAWTDGSIVGDGLVEVLGTLTIGGTSARELGTTTLVEGTVVSETGVTLTENAFIAAFGTWRGGGTVSRTSSPRSTFQGSGATIRAEDPSDPLRFTVPFLVIESTTLHAAGGDLRISFGGCSAAGAWIADAGREILFDRFPGGGPFEVTGNVDASGAGRLRLVGELQVQTDAQLQTSLGTSGGDGFLLDNESVLAVGGAVQNEGRMTWRAGRIEALPSADPSVLHLPGGTLEIIPGGSSIPTVDGVDFTSLGMITQTAEWRIAEDTVVTVTDGSIHELRAARLSGDGTYHLGESGLLLRPIDSPPGVSEVRCTLDADGGTIDNEAGELRIIGGGTLNGSAVLVDEGATTSLRTDPLVAADTVFSGRGEFVVESSGDLTVGAVTVINQMGLDEDAGTFRLGGSSPGILRAEQSGSFLNEGFFEWRLGDLVVPSGFLSPGTLVTGGPNNDLDGYLRVSGTATFAHAVQLDPRAELEVTTGELVLESSTTSLGAAAQVTLGGELRLDGTAGMNGAGQLVLQPSSTIRKTGGGLSAVSVDLVPTAPETKFKPSIIVESGTLAFSNQPAPEPIWASTQVGPGSTIRWNGLDHVVGPARPDVSVIGDLQGSIALAGPASPPRFECDTLRVEGRIRPGGAEGAGTLEIGADFELADTGILSVNVGANGSGLVVVEGGAALDGVVRVRLLDGHQPPIGVPITILTAAGGIVGLPAEVTGPGAWTAAVIDGALQITPTAAPTCPADFVGADGTVGLAELLSVLGAWGYAPSDPADLDGDDTVGIADLLGVLAAWGDCG